MGLNEHTSVMLLFFVVLFKGSFGAGVILVCKLFVVASAVPIIAVSCLIFNQRNMPRDSMFQSQQTKGIDF